MGKFIDMTGWEINGVQVIESIKNPTKSGNVRWRCKCFCGKEFIVVGSNLRNGNTQSCGCKKIKKSTIQPGEKYNSLLILERYDHIRWKCLCDCGNEIILSESELKYGRRKSCGCQQNRKIDITGKRFGFLTAIEPTEQRAGNSVVWRCKCDCGNEKLVAVDLLREGNTQSCGCQKNSFGEEKIKTILKENNIIFIKEKTYDALRFLDTNKMARYDFFLPNYNCLIEYDGKQHFELTGGFFGNEEAFKKLQKHDQIKNQFAKDNNINLIRIPYTEYDNIDITYLLPETSKFLIVKEQ